MKAGLFRLRAHFVRLPPSEKQDLTERSKTGCSDRNHSLLEMRYRFKAPNPVIHMEILPIYASADGTERGFTIYLSSKDEWQTTVWRLAADERLPKRWRPQALIGLSIKIHSKYPSELEIDWVRLRGFNAEEQQR